ncbi:MAG TPA: hypothetical protein VHW23_35180 [Kofleriaceae bacterium]|jgi:hypothetical protein|nr:hypothetical protein [Kofleriaceae bacterium]
MQRQPRLGRSEVIARLRALAAQHGGAVSPRLLVTHDGAAARSLRLHFPSFAEACRAAGVEVARPRRAGRRTARAVWSKRRVVDVLQRLDAAGASTGWDELMQRGEGALVRAAATHAGGLRRARAAAGVEPRGRPPGSRWDRAAILAAIRARGRARQSLASSKAPQRLVAAARWHLGSWEAALAAAGVDADAVRLGRGPLTRDEILDRIRGVARRGGAVRAATLKPVVKLDTVRKLFGSIEAAVRAAGIEPVLTHGNLKWTRARVIDELKARAVRGELRLTRGLARAVQLYFGGAHAARAAAGLAPLVRIAWTRPALIQELQRRARRGDRGRALWSACTRLFGSVAAARAAAGLPAGGAAGRGRGRAGGPKDLIERLRAWHAAGRPPDPQLVRACKQRFGSLVRACVAANVPVPAAPWTPRRVQQVLRDPGVDLADPELVAACIRHFGSVTAARAAVARAGRRRQWTRATLIAELQARSRRGLRGVGRLLRAPAVRLFGSTEAALAAASQAPPRRAGALSHVR